ncbi:hypothetical protein D3C87_1141250 [compost metagenome]
MHMAACARAFEGGQRVQAQRGGGHAVAAAFAAQRRVAARFGEAARAQVAVVGADEGFERDSVVQRHGIAEFGEDLAGAGAVAGLQGLVQARGGSAALGVQVVPGIGGAQAQVDLAGAGLEGFAAIDGDAVAVGFGAGGAVAGPAAAVGIAQGAAQPPAAADRLVAADGYAGVGLGRPGGVVIAGQRGPVAEHLRPQRLRGRLRQRRRVAQAQLGGRHAGHPACVDIGAQARHRRLGEGAGHALQARDRAGVRFAGDGVEGRGGRVFGQVQHVLVERTAGGQALQCPGHGALVAGEGGVDELYGASAPAIVGGDLFQVYDQVDPVAVVG